MAPIDIRMIPV